MKKSKKLIIFGTEDFADIAYEYFTHDSTYEVVGFTVDAAYLKVSSKFGLPVVPFESVHEQFASDSHEMFVAIVYAQLNRLRASVCERARQRGYALASYVSSRAFVWRNVQLGEHCFIFEDNTVQPFVSIGSNVIAWSGNHIGHHSSIGNNCFLTSHVVVSGWCSIGNNTFVGVNTTLANNTRVGEFCWIGHGSNVAGDIPDGSLVKAPASEISPLNEAALFRVLARSSRKRSGQ